MSRVATLPITLARTVAVAMVLAAAIPAVATGQVVGVRHGISLVDMDTTCAPCRDFNRFANGRWSDTATIPAGRSRIGAAERVRDETFDRLRGVVEEMARRSKLIEGRSRVVPPDRAAVVVGTFYASCMDSARAERDGVAPLRPLLNRIVKARGRTALSRITAELQLGGMNVLFEPEVFADPHATTTQLLSLRAGGLGMPRRSVYHASDSTSGAIRRAYVEHLARLFRLAGSDSASADQQARDAMGVELRLAAAALPEDENTNVDSWYHLVPRTGPIGTWNAFHLQEWLTAAGAASVTRVNTAHQVALQVVDSLFAARDLQPIRNYLSAVVLHANAQYLDGAFVQEWLRGRQAFTGELAVPPRWLRCMRVAQASIGQPLGRIFVERFFSESDRGIVKGMVQTLLEELKTRLAANSWMGEETRRSALLKAAALRPRIGYPDSWPSWAGLKVRPQPFVLNVLAAARDAKSKDFRAAGGPVNRNAWPDFIPPASVNAGFNEAANEVIFPAGVLQPPFFDPQADLASNFGAIGTAIGHEIMHAFDNEGRTRDETGRVRNWWSDADAKNFEARAARLVSQFDARVVLDSLHVNGRLTLGENIAELGGAELAYGALARVLGDRLRIPDETGYTAEQRFFIAYAQVYREKDTPQALRTRVATNPHAPGWTRVLGVVQNMPEFARAFQCLQGDPMVLSAPVRFLDPE